MGFDFKKAAQSTTSLSYLTAGKEALKTAAVVNQELTVIGFDLADKWDKKTKQPIVNKDTGEIEKFGIIIFSEYPNNYYCVGKIFTKICLAWAAGFDNDTVAASAELASSGGVKVKFYEIPGTDYVSVDILN